MRMVDDLLRRRRLIGLPRNELTALLGAPDETDKFSKADLVYWLGAERGALLALDSEWMLVFWMETPASNGSIWPTTEIGWARPTGPARNGEGRAAPVPLDLSRPRSDIGPPERPPADVAVNHA